MGSDPYYDPEIRAILDAGPPFGTVHAGNLETLRTARVEESTAVQLSDAISRTDVTIDGHHGHEVRLRVSRPVGHVGPSPALFWMHGGGYVMGSPEQDDLRFDRWCQRFDLVGVCVQYRLGPEDPYPAGLEDCYAGLSWLAEHGAEIGVDVGRIGIGGPSGGGGMAAALGLLTRDRGEIDLAFQMLIYPMLDDRRVSTTANWEVPIWDPASNEFGWRSYLGDLFGTDEVPGHAAPARAESLAGLPPTYVMVGSLDGFCDEDIEFAQRLNQGGVPVELHVYPGAPHGFEGFAPGAELARQARKDINAWLGRMLDPDNHESETGTRTES